MGLYDGLRVDRHGNLWLSAGDGVRCHAPDRALLGKVLAVTSRERMPQMPNLPTAIESGLAGFEVTSWQAVAAPKGTARDIVNKLQTDIARGLRGPDIMQRFTAQGFEIVVNTPEQASAFFKEEIERWAKVVKASGAEVD